MNGASGGAVLTFEHNGIRSFLAFLVFAWPLFLSFFAEAFEREHRESHAGYPSGTLTGDWGGARSSLFEKGIVLELEYTADVFGNLSGGNDRIATITGLAQLEAHIDTETLLRWKDSELYVSLIAPHGGKPSRNLGAVHSVSDIEAPNTVRLLEAWGEKRFLDERLSILAGLYAVDGEFDVQESASVFIGDGFGTGLELAGSGLNGPPAYPVGALGARVQAETPGGVYLQAAVLDGVPGDPSDPNGIRIKLSAADGVFFIAETGRSWIASATRRSKIGLGGWFYSADFDDLNRVDENGKPLRQTGTFGVYGFADAMLLPETGDPRQGLAGFLRLGYADDRVNQTEFYFNTGVTYTGLFSGRDEDVLGFGVSVSSNGERFIASQKNFGAEVEGREIFLEMVYRIQVLSWLVVKPDLQYIVNPGTESGRGDAFLMGTRFMVAF